MQSAKSSRPSSVAELSQIWLPQMTGEDQARPWMAVFHLTFCDSDQVVGRLLESVVPWPVGPRNWGQFSSARAKPESARRRTKVCFMLRESTAREGGR